VVIFGEKGRKKKRKEMEEKGRKFAFILIK